MYLCNVELSISIRIMLPSHGIAIYLTFLLSYLRYSTNPTRLTLALGLFQPIPHSSAER